MGDLSKFTIEELMRPWIFYCGHCGQGFDITNLEIYGHPKDNPQIIVCEGCAKQLGAIK